MAETDITTAAIIDHLKQMTAKMAATDQIIRDAVSQSAKVLDRPTAAKMMYSARRDREAFFDSDIFGEPAWDILLDLYIAHSEGRSISVSSAAIGARAAPTTSLRWISALVDRGLILREDAENDRRVTHVALTVQGIIAMERFLDRYLAYSLGRNGFQKRS